MIDLFPLRPTDNTPAAIAAAISRCVTAGRDALAELERLKAERAALFMAGSTSQVDQNSAKLMRASEDATQIGALIGQLQERLVKVAPAQSAEQGTPAEACAALAGWVATNSETLVRGMQLLSGVFRALAPSPRPASEPPTMPTNVVPLTTPPGVA